MNVVVPIEADAHQAIQALLPWHERGQLTHDEAALVLAHLQQCAACRAAQQAERSLGALLTDSAEEPGPDTEAALVRMRARLKAEAPLRPQRRWMPWALGLQTGAIALLLALLVRPGAEAPAAYKGLAASAGAPRAEALVMFRPEATERRARQALLDHGAVIVAGPTEAGAYRITLPAHRQALAALRGEPVVLMAEALNPAAQP